MPRATMDPILILAIDMPGHGDQTAIDIVESLAKAFRGLDPEHVSHALH